MCGNELTEEATFDIHITLLANTNDGHKPSPEECEIRVGFYVLYLFRLLRIAGGRAVA